MTVLVQHMLIFLFSYKKQYENLIKVKQDNLKRKGEPFYVSE